MKTIIISSHSSQLKNLVFSPANVGFLEVVPLYFVGAFSAGTEHMGIHYRYSVGHKVLNTSRKSRNCNYEDKRFVHCDYVVNMTRLVRDVENLMAIQKVWCPNLWPCL